MIFFYFSTEELRIYLFSGPFLTFLTFFLIKEPKGFFSNAHLGQSDSHYLKGPKRLL